MNCDPTSLMQAARCMECIPPGMQAGVRSYLLCQWANEEEHPIGCSDPILDDYLDRLELLGIAPADMPTESQQTALCNFCHALRLAGIQDKFAMLNPIINVGTPNRLDVMVVPLILNTLLMSNFVNNGFVAADLTDQGLVGGGNALGKYMDTLVFCDPDVLLASTGFSVYESVAATIVETEVELGTNNTVPNTKVFITCFDPGIVDGFAGIYGAVTPLFGNVADTPGFYSCNRTALDLHKGYYGSSLTLPNVNLLYSDFTDVSLESQPADAFAFMALNEDAVIKFCTSRTVSFVSIGAGLTQNETTDLFSAVQQLRIDLGGGFV